MSRFNQRPFDERLAFMGDESEMVYEQTKPLGNTIRFGWRRPKAIAVNKLPPTFRYAPDYFAQSGYFVEVMGLGRDGILKGLKVDKWEAMKVWRRIATSLELHDLMYYIWNSHKRQYIVVPHGDMVGLVAKSKRQLGIQAFDDGNEYYPIEWEWLVDAAAWVGDFNIASED